MMVGPRIVVRHLQDSSLEGSQSVFLETRVRLGRRPDNGVVFDPIRDPLVSGYHAELLVLGGDLLIRDVGSRNGTFVNGRQIAGDTPLGPEDRVRLGASGPEFLAACMDQASGQPAGEPEPTAFATPDAARENPTGSKRGVSQDTLFRAIASVTRKERTRSLLLLAVSGAFLIGAAVYFSNRGGGQGSTPSDATEPGLDPLAAAARRFEKSVFLIVTPVGSSHYTGTGFVVDSQGLLATNSHVVEEMRPNRNSFVVQNMTHERFEVENWSPHPRYNGPHSDDVALVKIKIDGRELLPFPLATEGEWRDLGRGVKFGTLGFPGEFSYIGDLRSASYDLVEATFKDGRIGRITDYGGRAAKVENTRSVQHNALVTPGTSGSPLFTPSGKVIGVHNSGRRQPVQDGRKLRWVPDATGTRWAVRIDALAELLAAPNWKR